MYNLWYKRNKKHFSCVRPQPISDGFGMFRFLRLHGDYALILCIALFAVFPVASPLGRYRIKTPAAANLECGKYGAKLASYAQLKEAHTKGYERCRCGWLSEGIVRYPMQRKASGCGYAKHINYCPTDYTKWKKWGWYRGWDAYCFLQSVPKGAFQMANGYSKFTYRSISEMNPVESHGLEKRIGCLLLAQTRCFG